MSHEQKYLKYKIKYLELLDDMSGGGKHSFKLVEDLIKWLRAKMTNEIKDKDRKHLSSIYVFTPEQFSNFTEKYPKWNSGNYEEPMPDNLTKKINLIETKHIVISTGKVSKEEVKEGPNKTKIVDDWIRDVDSLLYTEIGFYLRYNKEARQKLVYLHGKD